MTNPEHGTRARYQNGCKCRECNHANTAYQRRYREITRPRRTVRVTTPGGITYEQLMIDDG